MADDRRQLPVRHHPSAGVTCRTPAGVRPEDWDIEPESGVMGTAICELPRMIGRGWVEVHDDLRVDDVALFERNDCGD